MSLLDRMRRKEEFGQPEKQRTRAVRRITRYIGAAQVDPESPDPDLDQKIAYQERMRRVQRVISDNVSDQMGIGFRDVGPREEKHGSLTRQGFNRFGQPKSGGRSGSARSAKSIKRARKRIRAARRANR